MTVASIFIQLLTQAILQSQITSAGGDSPKINRVLYMDINAADFESVIEAEIRALIDAHIDDMQATGGLPGAGAGGGGARQQREGEGFSEAEAVGFGRQAVSTLRDPTTLVSEGLSNLPHAIAISFALSLIPIIINELTKPGGPWDLRFKRMVEKEFNGLMDRQTQYDIRIGERSIIVQSRAGFINANGAASNTTPQRRESASM